AAFGIFVTPGATFGNAIGFNGGQELNQFVKSARPGQQVTLIGTGLGAVSGDEKNPVAVQDVAADVKVFVAGKAAEVVSKGRVGLNEIANGDSLKLPRGLSAVDQVTFTVPDGVTGCAASVAVQIGERMSNWATLSVAPEGGVCADLAGLGDLNQYYTSEPLKVGSISMIRTAIGLELGPLGSLNINTDAGSASFFKNAAVGVPASALTFSPVSTGQCIAVVGQIADVDGPDEEPEEISEGTPLDAGEALRIQGPKGVRELKKVSTGNYADSLGTGSDTALPFPVPIPGGGKEPFLDPGEYTVDNGAGGADIGAFQVKARVSAPLNWTNRAQITAVTRANGVDVTWTGAEPGSFVMIVGFSSNGNANASFYCIADAAAGRINVPSQVLLRLPASGAPAGPEAATGALFVANTNGVKVDIPGLDLAVFSTGVLSGKTLPYR
ncbi:MAG: hypothetical protein SFV51_05235, partial [Bryobacteraceae bacterium]|nr:hypothetical protein [Bryobacteraceae bacterium]